MSYQDMPQEYLDFNSEYDYHNITGSEDQESEEE